MGKRGLCLFNRFTFRSGSNASNADEESGEEQGEPSAEQIRALEAAKEAERKKRIDSLWEEMKASRLDNKATTKS